MTITRQLYLSLTEICPSYCTFEAANAALLLCTVSQSRLSDLFRSFCGLTHAKRDQGMRDSRSIQGWLVGYTLHSLTRQSCLGALSQWRSPEPHRPRRHADGRPPVSSRRLSSVGRFMNGPTKAICPLLLRLTAAASPILNRLVALLVYKRHNMLNACCLRTPSIGILSVHEGPRL